MLNPQEQALIKLYKTMPAATIRARLRDADLTQLARGVAENELQLRGARAGNAEQAAPVAPAHGLMRTAGAAVALVVLAALLAWGAATLLHSPLAFVLLGIAGCIAAQVLGKAFPLFGKGLGGLLIVAAGGVVVLCFTAQVGREERMLMGVFGCIAVFVLLMMAINLISGANNKRPWGAFAAELNAAQEEARESMH